MSDFQERRQDNLNLQGMLLTKMDGLEKLVNEKFDGLQKQIALQNDNHNLKIEPIRSDIAKLDIRVSTLESQVCPKGIGKDFLIWAIKGLIIFAVGCIGYWVLSGMPKLPL